MFVIVYSECHNDTATRELICSLLANRSLAAICGTSSIYLRRSTIESRGSKRSFGEGQREEQKAISTLFTISFIIRKLSALKINVFAISLHRHRRRYHSLLFPSAASAAPSSACSIVDDANTSVEVVGTSHPHHRSMRRITHCHRLNCSVDRSTNPSRCSLVSICRKFICHEIVIRAIDSANIYILCSSILKPSLDLPITQTQLHRKLPSVLGREIFMIRESPLQVLCLLGREANLSSLSLRATRWH